MQTAQPIKEIETLSKLLLVGLDVNIWSGRKKLRIEDLGPGVDLPPAELASLGSKRIMDPEQIKRFDNLKRRAHRLLESEGVRFLGGYGIPNDAAPAIAKELDDIQREFGVEIKSFLDNYDSNFDAWAQKWDQDPKWQAAIEKAKTPKEVVAQRLGFRYTLVRVVPDKSDPALSKGLEQEVEGLSGQLFREIADAAEDLVDGSFANKSSVSRKAVSAILKIHRKLTSLAFLNPGIHLVAEHMMSVIAQLPKRGPYEGGHFQTLQTLMLSLSDERNISKLAASFAASAAQTATTGGVPAASVVIEQAPAAAGAVVASAAVIEQSPSPVDDGGMSVGELLDEIAGQQAAPGLQELSSVAAELQARAIEGQVIDTQMSALGVATSIANIPMPTSQNALDFCM